jgi:low temperature requirement protein LtrA
MMSSGGHLGWLRGRGEGQAEVRPVELFFDLVYVLAVTQLTHHLLDHLSLRGAGETLLLLLAVWGAWIYTSWFTNYFDPDMRAVRLMLVGLMLTSLIISASIPEAFGDQGLVFAAAYVALNLGRTAFALATLGRRHPLTVVFQRPPVWWSISGLLWLAGGLAHGDLRVAIWAMAVLVEYGGVWLGFPVPGLGRSRTTDYTISGEHMAERCRLFVILALGESILVTGANFGELPRSAQTIAAFVVAFIGSVTLWWIYFDRAEEAGRRVISAAGDPGRLGVLAYTYFHIPMVAGIIAAAGADELTIAHPTDEATVATTALILGGPALYLVGNALFKWALWDRLPRSRLVAICALAALVPLAVVSSALGLLVAATLVIVAVALWDLRAERMKLSST